jgi:hypothetical protein
MFLHFGANFSDHQMGEHATHPIARPPSRLALLLLVAGPALRPSPGQARGQACA